LSKLIATIPSEIPECNKQRLEQILCDNIEVFSLHQFDVGHVKGYTHRVQFRDPDRSIVQDRLIHYSQPMTLLIKILLKR
jgi:hypothetical protein